MSNHVRELDAVLIEPDFTVASFVRNIIGQHFFAEYIRGGQLLVDGLNHGWLRVQKQFKQCCAVLNGI
jgi:hypothetical protein